MKIPETRIQFRNDIQYLRAVSVLGVIGYHAPFEIFRGGWLGVDIFFVISGFLISNIIISDFQMKNFLLKNFTNEEFKELSLLYWQRLSSHQFWQHFF